MIQYGADAAREAARLYRSTGALSGALLRPEIHRAWERSHAMGADPRQVQAESLDPRGVAANAAQYAAFMAAAEPYLHALSHAAGAHQHAVVLSDEHAIVLERTADQAHLHGQGWVPAPGALLSEGTAGANGVGTPLAEGRYIEIVGPEHFIAGFQEFTCQGIPVRDGTGQIVGALCTQVRSPEVSVRLREMLVCAAHGIEAELLRASLSAWLERVLADPSPTHQVLERLYSDLIEKHASARVRVELASQQLGRGLTIGAADVLKLALRALEDYRREAASWRALAAPEAPAQQPAPVALDEAARDLAILLEDEAANHQCQLVLRDLEPVIAQAAPGALRLALLRAFLTALAQGRGGAVLVDVHRGPGQGLVSLTPRPGPHVVRSAPGPIQVTALL